MKKKQKPWVWALHTHKRALRIMKAIVVLFLIGIVQAYSATSYSQEKQVNLKLNNVKIIQVISALEEQSNYKFFFSPQSMDVNQTVSIDAKNENIEDVLDELFGQSNVAYRIIDNQVILTTKEVAVRNATQQALTISGTVVDVNGEPLPGVNVYDKSNPTNGGITDFDGNYNITVSNGDAILVFSYIGFVPQEVNASGRTNINITLVEEFTDLNEVVVVGYGAQRKVNLTGAIATVNAEQMEERPNDNILKSIQGTVPGVMVLDRPGGVSINIRGRGNLGNSAPLYIIDNVEVTEAFFSNLDPASIENITFLKDASSAAIYGAKAAYGVVLVTTKEGKEGKTRITYNGSIGFQAPTVLPDVVSSAEYGELYSVAQRNMGVAEEDLLFSQDMINKYRSGVNPDIYPNTNWFDEVMNQNPFFTKHSLNITSGTEKITNMFNLGYLGSEEFSPGITNDRFNFTNKTKMKFNDKVSLTTGITYIHTKYDRTKGQASFFEALRVPPTQVARHSNGSYGTVRNGVEVTGEEARANPLRMLNEGGRGNSTKRELLGTLNLEIKPTTKLTITNQFAYRYENYRSFSFINSLPELESFLNPGTTITGSGVSTNQMDLNSNYNQKYVYDGWVTYNETINDHSFVLLGGAHVDTYLGEWMYMGRKNFGSNDMGAIDGGSTNPDDQLVSKHSIGEESLLSFFGRASYDYKGKYLLEANLRADASSRFAESGRWGYFPSFSAGWRISEEEFMQGLEWLDNLKLRASYGQSGNIKNVGLYDTYPTYSESGTAIIGGGAVPIVSEGRIVNPDLTWETAVTSNIGVDAGFFNGGLNISLEYYNRTTEDILVRADDNAIETGLDSDKIPAKNVGIVRNSGFEFVATHAKTLGDFSYTVSTNASINNNEVVDLGDVENLPPNSYWIYQVGQSVGSFFMLEADGLYSEQDIADGKAIPLGSQMPEAGMIKYVDKNGDGVINDDDRTVVGNDVPSFIYGMNIDLKYKNWGLSIVGQGVTNTQVYLDMEASQIFFDNSVPRDWQRDYWTPDNQGADYPKLFLPSDARYTYNTGQTSSFWLFNASYFRMKNITASYTMPNAKTSSWGIEDLRFYVSADNAFTIRGDKRMKDFEVERSSGRSAQLGTITYTAGVSFAF
ncbi:TonB-dependent receptor [Carboxylicivirga mesophila]|uniref:TonB-dependent receptor n=1 Tax=Carboxylicivirga mesophila TaxID=1166478 RepID=A0ABS5KG75_9BACT|nr:TonB-dependent receptor [Carboxylicivirga mesophila]MBS2213817.1 TonB-dependent receptor [Carboxylicivirga mesophila]